jgi:phenylalanyl-tRNA synthetase beta chain
VAIGTHDLDTLSGPFSYKALSPELIQFQALNQSESKTAEDLLKIYSSDVRMKQYVPIIQNSPVYPLITDSKNVVLSMPPIINGDHSKITLKTQNVFIECTGTDKHKADIVLNTILAAFSQYSSSPYSVEPVKVEYEDHEEETPKFLNHSMRVDPSYVNTLIGISISPQEMQGLLLKMGVKSEYSEGSLLVHVPITRTDIIHPCDVAEDIGIAYGYNKITRILPKTLTVGKEQPLNLVSDLLRVEVGLAGYTEILTFVLHSFDFNYKMLRKPVDDKAVEISNPKALEFQMPRTTLIPGILRTIATNTKQQLPLKVFELSDVVFHDEKEEVKARNKRFLAAGYCGNTSGLENIHGLLDVVMKKMAFQYGSDYLLRPSDDASFFPKRQAQVVLQGVVVGIFGIIHPEVLHNFGINFPVSLLEIDIETIASLSRV